MAVIYSDYSRARIGWFFGLSGWQLATIALTLLPVFWAVQRSAWMSALVLLLVWGVVMVVTIVPVQVLPVALEAQIGSKKAVSWRPL